MYSRWDWYRLGSDDKSQGHVAKEFKEDVQLEAALHDRLKKIAAFMTPNIRIGLLTERILLLVTGKEERIIVLVVLVILVVIVILIRWKKT